MNIQFLCLDKNVPYPRELMGAFREQIRNSRDLTIRFLESYENNRTIWQNDPSIFTRDGTYIDLAIFQGHIENVQQLNLRGDCSTGCGQYQYVESVSECSEKSICSKKMHKKCNGKVFNCTSFESGQWICPSNRSSIRRYESINSRENQCSYGYTVSFK